MDFLQGVNQPLDPLHSVYDNVSSEEEVWDTIWHEILHGIAGGLKINSLKDWKDEQKHEDLRVLALAITDSLY